ncbi:MAG: replicative DNA helicase [Deltaproteobacteria bacterium]|nr:replicative DNA helicase [Deltaproteobacteria bacterium]
MADDSNVTDIAPLKPYSGFNSNLPSRANPLHDVVTERALLGALLVNINECAPQVLELKLKATDFYKEAHGHIYSSILRLFDQNKKVDVFTLNEELVSQGLDQKIGGHDYLVKLWDESGLINNVDEYAKILIAKSQARELIAICGEISDMCQKNQVGVSEILDIAESRIFALRESRDSGRMVYVPDELPSVYKKVAALYGQSGQNSISGLPTGYSRLDYLTGGFQPSDLIILGGRPGMGKTSLALNIALMAALNKKRECRSDLPPYSVAFFSMEMSIDQLIQRLMCQLGAFNLMHIRSGRLTEAQMAELPHVVSELLEARMYVDETSAITPMDLRARTRRLKRRLEGTKYPLKMIIVDYLQLMRPNERHNNLEQAVREISGALKALAKELNITVMALSQLKRVDNVAKPSLSDLRDSGAIEQDADIVMFVVRESEANPEKAIQEGDAKLFVRKHRNGPTGVIPLYFNKACSSFEPGRIQDIPGTTA